MDIQTWYGSSLRLPLYFDYRFRNFVVSSIGLIKSVVKRGLKSDIYIRFAKVEVAAADQETSTILLAEGLLAGIFSGSDRKHTTSETLSAILGIVVHEAAHFAWSPPLLTPFAERVKEASSCAFMEKVALVLGNVVEDIYIENRVRGEVPSLAWTLDCCNAVLLSDDDLGQSLLEVEGIAIPPANLNEVATAINLLIFAKMNEMVETTPFMTKLFSLVRSVIGMDEIEQRLDLTVKIYNLLMEKVESDIHWSFPLVTIDKLLSGTADHQVDMSEVVISVGDSDINRVLERLDYSTITVDMAEDDLPITFIEVPVSDEHKPVKVDNRYLHLTEHTRQRSTVNKPYGTDRKTGNNIRRLSRIATDQKIFAEKVAMNDYKPMQVAILIDFSGSMRSYGGAHEECLYSACSAAAGAALALAEGRCEVAVYGHTADRTRDGDVLIWRFKHFREPTTYLTKRLGFCHDGDATYENRDGDAIRYMGRQFYGMKRKLLIVISDGAPEAHNYNGHPAIEHTRGEVIALRERNIDVVSISINEHASNINDRIYGSQHNVYNQDPNVIEKIVRSLFT